MVPFLTMPYLKIPLEDRGTARNVASILQDAMTVDEWNEFSKIPE